MHGTSDHFLGLSLKLGYLSIYIYIYIYIYRERERERERERAYQVVLLHVTSSMACVFGPLDQS